MKRNRPDRREKRPDQREPRRDADRSTSVIYGVSPVIEALKAKQRVVERVIFAEGSREGRLSEIISLCREGSIAYDRAPREQFAKLVGAASNHQGVLAITAAASYVSTDEILDDLSETPLLLVLDGVEDPRNLGAILRVAECAGVDGIVIPERRAVGLNDTVAKSSAGAVEHVRVAKTPNLNRFIEELKERGFWVIGTSVDAETIHTEWDWDRPTALVLGGEGSGLHRLVAENCDVLVKIPMYGKIDSLNVSVAAGVLLFEARRRRTSRE